MKHFLCLFLCLTLLTLSFGAMAEPDYNVAEKLLRQIEAPSGFEAKLRLDVQDMAGQSRLQSPFTFALSYLEKPGDPRDRRLQLNLMKDESPVSTLEVRIYGSEIDFHADVLSPDWYSLGSDSAAAVLPLAALGEEGASSLLQFTGAPVLTELSAQILPRLMSDKLDDLAADLTTRLDLWIEGYRGEPILEDGTITVEYVVPAAALKAEIKTLLLDLLENEQSQAALKEALGEETVSRLFNPSCKQAYFDAVDALPLTGKMMLERTVSMKGETRHLLLTLPLYDKTAGDLTLTYERTAEDQDKPEEESLGLYGRDSETEIIFNRYTTEEGLRVWSGSLHHADPNSEKELEFSLNHKEENSTTDSGEECTRLSGGLSVTPGKGCTLLTHPAEASYDLSFTSPTSKKAATAVKGQLSFCTDSENRFVLDVEGSTVKAWEMNAFREKTVSVSDMDVQDILLLVTGLVGNVNKLYQDQLPKTAE